MTAHAEFTELTFTDGEKNIQLHERAVFYQAEFGEKAIQFYWLREDGSRPMLPSDPARVEHRPNDKLLGGTSYAIYATQDGRDKATWYGYSTSTVSTLNDVSKTQLQPHGAHELPIMLLDADREDGLFTNQLMVQAIADGVFIVATNAPNFLHDTDSHGLGIITLEATTVATLQRLCKLALLQHRHPEQMTALMTAIIRSYDLTTYQYAKPSDGKMFRQLEPIRRDPLLTTLVEYCRIDGRVSNDFFTKILRTIELGPFKYGVDNRHVRRDRPIVNYYRSIGELVT